MTPLFSTSELAARLGLAEITLRKWRIYGTGPRFVRLGATIRYRAEDIDAWVASRGANSTSERSKSPKVASRHRQAGGGSPNV